MARSFNEIVQEAKEGGARKRLAVPSVKKHHLEPLSRAAKEGFVTPLLIGNSKTIKAMVGNSPLASLPCEIVEAGNPAAALQQAIALTRDGRADILLQGGADQKSFMNAVLDAKTGLLKGKLASYASVFQIKQVGKLILATDTLLNNFPGIAEKQIIVENALGLASQTEGDCSPCRH